MQIKWPSGYRMRFIVRIAFTFISLCMCVLSYAQQRLNVVFTSDLHSCAWNYSKIAYVIETQRQKSTSCGIPFIVLDAGDIAMGSVYHSVFDTHAVEYRSMARMGYDAIAQGNHDFDFGVDALVRMYKVAWQRDSLIEPPALLCANVTSKSLDKAFLLAQKAFRGKYKIFEKGGVKIGVLGVLGEEAYNVIGKDREKLTFYDPVKECRKIVGELKKTGVDYIIVISHGGTASGNDIDLAESVDGIDLIISGHDHDLLREPLKVGNTYIVAAASDGRYVGKVELEGRRLKNYTLFETDGVAQAEPSVGRWVDSMQMVVSKRFYKESGVNLEDTVTFLSKGIFKDSGSAGEDQLGNLIAKSYRKSVIDNIADADSLSVVGMVPYGVIRGNLKQGTVTYNNVFDILPLGYNSNGYTGYPLVYGYLTGAEIKDICQMNETISPYIGDIKIFFSGVNYTTRWWGLPFFKVKDVHINGEPMQEDKLYLVVTGEYTARLIGTLKRESFGILSATIKDSKGNPIAFEQLPSIKERGGNIVTEWLSLARYLKGNSKAYGAKQ